MKTSFIIWSGVVAIGFSSVSTALAGKDKVLFEDDFESGSLAQWVGDVHGPHHGQIVADPLRPGNHVLTFTELDANGDVFTLASIPLGSGDRPYIVSFDYLGAAKEGSIVGNLGGFLGIATSIDEWQQGRIWIAGTDPSGLNAPSGLKLADDGAWHHYQIDISSLVQEKDLSEVHLMAEDWRDIGGVPGDVFFDNIRLVAGTGHEPKIDLHVTEVTLCWDSVLNLMYQVQSRSSRTPGGWTSVGDPIAGTGETLCVRDHLAVNEPQRFYRVIELP